MITHRLKVTENRTIERLDHKPIVAKSNGADFIQFTFENPAEWNITGVLVVYMFNGAPYGSCIIDQDSNGNPLALTEVDGTWQLTVPVPYQCITSEGYLYTGLSLFRTDIDASASTDSTPHIVGKISTALLSQPIQILKNGGLDEIDVAASPNDDLLVRMKLFVQNFSADWMEKVDNKFEDLDKTINGDSETGGGLISDITTNTNNILGLQERIDELDDNVDALDIIINGTEEIINDDGSVEQGKVTGLVELQKKDAADIASIQSAARVEHDRIKKDITTLKEKDDKLAEETDELAKGQEDNTTKIEEITTTLEEQGQNITALKSTVENPVFDTAFSDTSTSAIQNKVLTNFLNGMPTEVVVKATADEDSAWFLVGQEQLKYDSSTGEISNTDPATIGGILFSPTDFSATVGNGKNMLLQLNPNPNFKTLTVNDWPSRDDSSAYVPNTGWVSSLVQSKQTYPALLHVDGIYVPYDDDPLTETMGCYLTVKDTNSYSNGDASFRFKDTTLWSDTFEFSVYGNVFMHIVNANALREIGVGRMRFYTDSILTGRIESSYMLDANEDGLVCNLPFCDICEIEEEEEDRKGYARLNFGVRINLLKEDGSSFTESDKENIINMGITVEMDFVSNIEIIGWTQVVPR